MNSTLRRVVGCALIVIVVSGVAGYAAYDWYTKAHSTKAPVVATLPADETHVLIKGQINGHSLSIEKVADDARREEGLSGRKSLAPLDGMLFLFPKDDYYAFWMKDMKFPIDIVWLDGQMQVVDTTENLPPSSYPNTFRPRKPARNVLELNAGAVKSLGIHSGDMLELFGDSITTQ